MKNLLTIQGLTVKHATSNIEKVILNDVSISLNKNESIGIVGESGSGKTQLVLSILGINKTYPGITDGSIHFNNLDLSFNSRAFRENIKKVIGKEIAFVFQDSRATLVPYQTIYEQGLDTWKRLNQEADSADFLKEAISILEEMNISEPERILYNYPNQLSGGECQRAYIMLILLGNPSLMIADEPTSSLDPISSKKLIALIKSLCLKKQTSLVLISHDLNELIDAVEFIYVVYKGVIIEELSLRSNGKKALTPNHPYTKFLFSMASGDAFRSLRVDSEQEFQKPAYNGNNTISKSGCPYAKLCPMREQLEGHLAQKCLNVEPKIVTKTNGARVACWGYE